MSRPTEPQRTDPSGTDRDRCVSPIPELGGDPAPRRILLECTHTFFHGGNTGIQRVVRNVVNQARDLSGRVGVECVPVYCDGAQLFEADRVTVRGRPAANVEGYFREVFANGKRFFRSLFPVPNLKRFAVVRGIVHASRALRRAASAMLRAFGRLSRRKTESLDLREGDVLFLLDSSWHYSGLPTLVSDARRAGASVGFLLYDIMPVRFPQFSVKALVDSFQDWLTWASDQCDFFIAISDSARRDLIDHSVERLGDSSAGTLPRALRRSGSFRLGADLDQAGPEAEARPEIRELFARDDGRRTFLTVGTIEPRKNHKNILAAFERVWQQGRADRLVVVGRPGWLCDYILNRIHTHPEYGGRLILLDDLNDAELGEAYRGADALVFSSFGEGFGLPIVEALNHGLPVLASDIPVHRETGGDHCTYFGLDSPEALARAILEFEPRGSGSRSADEGGFEWPNWRQSTDELLRVILELAPERAPATETAFPDSAQPRLPAPGTL